MEKKVKRKWKKQMKFTSLKDAALRSILRVAEKLSARVDNNLGQNLRDQKSLCTGGQLTPM